MKKLTAKFFGIICGIFALCVCFVSCDTLFGNKNQPVQEKAYITITTNLSTNARTVLPREPFSVSSTGLTWTLTGSLNGGTEQELGKWEDTIDVTEENTTTAYNNMISDTSITLNAGTWTFTLTAENNSGKVLEATITQMIIGGENTLSFVMEEATGDNVAGGQIEFTLKWKQLGVVEEVQATLYEYGGNDNPNTLNIKFEADDNKSYEYVTCTNESELQAGNYLLKLELQQGTDKTINTYTCLIHVAPGLCSKGDYILETLAQLFNISYMQVVYDAAGSQIIELATFDETTTITTSYNKYTSFTLPTPIREGYEFLGWYTDEGCTNEVESPYNISADTTLYAKWEEIETVFAEKFVLKKQDEFTNSVDLEENESSFLEDGKYTEININQTSVISAWTYYVFPEYNKKFTEEGNYKVSVELWAETDTVVAISAARSDMFFTVKGNSSDEDNWTECVFETGLIKDYENAGISFGVGMSSRTRIRNLTVTKIENENLPALAFNITKQGIENYLNQQTRPEKIIDVSTTTGEDGGTNGYSITINTPLSHNDESSNSVVQDVTLDLRGYAETAGINKVSFELATENTVYTSFCADTNSSKSFSWNNAKTKIENTSKTLETLFPVYEENEELSVSLIKESDSGIDNNTSFSIKNFTVADGIQSFSGKDFVIKIHNNDGSDTFYKSQDDTLPFEQEISLTANESREFDVLMFNDFEENSLIDWEDVTRFIYSDTEKDIVDGKLRYYINEEGKYFIENKSDSLITCKITLTDELKVTIEEVSTETGGGEIESPITVASWEELYDAVYELNDDGYTTDFLITENLTATKTIELLCPIKITAAKDITITRADSFQDCFFSTAVSLEISGTENAIITLDGGSNESILADSPMMYATSNLTLSYCNLENNTNTGTNYDGGVIYITGTSVGYVNISNCNFMNNSVTGSFMAGGAIAIDSTSVLTNFENCVFDSNKALNQGGGAIYISGSGSNCSEKWHSFNNCSFTNNESRYSSYNYGGAIYVSRGPISLNNVTMSDNKYYSSETATEYVSSDIYINGYQQELKLAGTIKISAFKLQINSNTKKDIGIANTFDTSNSEILKFILNVSSGTVSNVSQPFGIYTYETVGTLVDSEKSTTLTEPQILCFKSITDTEGKTYNLNSDGTIILVE